MQAREFVVWIADSPVLEWARLHRCNAWAHHPGFHLRRQWGVQRELWRDPQLRDLSHYSADIFVLRTRRLVVDAVTLPAQGIEEGDVLVLLPEDSKNAALYLEGMAHHWPLSVPLDVRSAGPLPITEVLGMLEARSSAGMTFNVGGNLINSGVMAQSIRNSTIAVESSSAPEQVKALLRQLHKHVGDTIDALPAVAANDIELVTDDLTQFADEAVKPPVERSSARLRRAANNLVAWATTVAGTATPIVELIGQVRELVGT